MAENRCLDGEMIAGTTYAKKIHKRNVFETCTADVQPFILDNAGSWKCGGAVAQTFRIIKPAYLPKGGTSINHLRIDC